MIGADILVPNRRQVIRNRHYNDVIMSGMASQITSLTIVYSGVYSGVYQRKHQSSASLAFVRGIHRWPMNSPHKGPVTRKVFSFDDGIMAKLARLCHECHINDLLHNIHYSDVIMDAVASQITDVSNICWTVCSGRSTKTSRLRATFLCEGNLPVTDGFPSQRASNAENDSIWWRHRDMSL